MPIWGWLIFLGLIILKPFVIGAAIRAVYRRLPLTDRALAAISAAIFSAYFVMLPLLLFVLAGVPLGDLLLWGLIGLVSTFIVSFPLASMMMPSLFYLLRNVPRAPRLQH